MQPVPKRKKLYPIHNLVPGPNYMKPAALHYENGEVEKEFFTHNPIPEDEEFVTEYNNLKITFQVYMNFIGDPDSVFVKVINVEEKDANTKTNSK